MSKDNGFTNALERVKVALAAMGSGNPQPYIDCWAQSDDTTLFGAWGPIEKGYRQLTRDLPLGRQPLQGWAVGSREHGRVF